MAEINWTAEAERWLIDIYDYNAGDNPGAAIGVVEGVKVYMIQSSFFGNSRS
jgi:toxin ParE1/3/4